MGCDMPMTKASSNRSKYPLVNLYLSEAGASTSHLLSSLLKAHTLLDYHLPKRRPPLNQPRLCKKTPVAPPAAKITPVLTA